MTRVERPILAFIFETSVCVFKRHASVQREFSRLVRDDPRVDSDLRTFLSRTCQLKGIADYLTGPGSHVPPESAREAIQTARRLVECVAGLLSPNGQIPARTSQPDRSR
jgi:hypothetical protein